MRFHRLSTPCLVLLALTFRAPTLPASTLEHEFRFDSSRLRLAERNGVTTVDFRGAMPEFRAGRPDLPWLGENLELPPGLEVTAVRVIEVHTAPLRDHARLPSAVNPRPGIGPLDRTAPDPQFFGRPGFQPEVPIELGYQGWMRGRHLACFHVCPARWDPSSGRLEQITRLRVRLNLGPAREAPLQRERIVPEWEEGPLGPLSSGAVIAHESARDPATGRPRPFRATQIPSLLGSPVAYVIVTSDELAPQFQRLADWKTQAGVPAVVRTLSWIQQEYPQGSDDAERVRLFIRDAYARWGTQWVLLGGDTDVIPTRLAYTIYYGGESIPCDMYFSCLDGNWNGDGDSRYGEGQSAGDPGDDVDLLPEVWVGRAPSLTVADAQRFVDKTLQYERQSAGDYENTALFFAEVLVPQNWNPGDYSNLDGAKMAEDLLPSLRTIPSIHYGRLYENYTNPAWEPGALQETRGAVLDSLDRGYNLAVHIGHGYRNVMSCGDANIDNGDAQALTNGNRLTNLYSINCSSNAIDFPSIGEAFINAPNGGAVTNVGCTRFDFPIEGQYFQREYFRLVFEDSITAVGEAQARQKLPFVAASEADNVSRWITFTLLLLGDPELRMYTGLPRSLTVAHPASIALGDTSIAVDVSIGGMPLYGARVTAYKADDEFSTGTTDGAGRVVLPFRPDSLGDFTLTVTGYDCRPYQATVPITATGDPVLVDLATTIDDDSLNGTLGDGNGLLDAGETADLIVPVQNNGGIAAPIVVGTLSSPDPMVAVVSPQASYGTVPAGSTKDPFLGYRIALAVDTPDQREIPFQLDLLDGGGHHWKEQFQLVVSAPELARSEHQYADAGGNNDGRPDPGETVTLTPRLINLGTGTAHQVSATLRSLDGMANLSDSTSSFGDLEPGSERLGDALVFVPSSASAKLQLQVFDTYGLRLTQTIDLGIPDPPAGLTGTGFASSIAVSWERSLAPDLLGYFVYRRLPPGGAYGRVNAVPTDRTAYFLDEHLVPLTAYDYQVTAVDSSGNESAPSPAAELRTTPPNHTIFPIPMGDNTPSSVAVDHLYPGVPLNIVVGADVLYCWNPDGTAPVDADGAGITSGDFTTRGADYLAGPSIADLDGDGINEIIGVNWAPSDTARVFVFDREGNVLPGWPATVSDSIWSSAAIGDVDNDGKKEMFFGTFGPNFYGLRHDGSEVRDGDHNPATQGVFEVLGAEFNLGTPALADLDHDGYLDIIYGSFDGKLYAWRKDGSDLPGFPVQLSESITGSAAVGYLDGPSDAELDIVVPTGSLTLSGATDSLYAFRANGQRRPGWPIRVLGSGNGRTPSPALADMNNDGFVDVVQAGTDGVLHVFDRDGHPLAPLDGVRYSLLTLGASEASPAIADIDGDGLNDVVMGDELGRLTAISGTGSVLPGFPIQLSAEVKGSPAVCDCDGDGMSELVVAGWDRNLYMWDYDFPFSPDGVPPWPQYHHDAMRSGLATNLPFVVVDKPGVGSAPTGITFAAPWPNPAGKTSRIRFAVPAERAGENYEIAVLDLSGRRVKRLERGTARVSQHFVEWDLRDQAGRPVGAGVYFLRLTIGSEQRAQKLIVLR